MILKGVLDQHFMEGEKHYVGSATRFFLWGHNACHITIKKFYPYLTKDVLL